MPALFHNPLAYRTINLDGQQNNLHDGGGKHQGRGHPPHTVSLPTYPTKSISPLQPPSQPPSPPPQPSKTSSTIDGGDTTSTPDNGGPATTYSDGGDPTTNPYNPGTQSSAPTDSDGSSVYMMPTPATTFMVGSTAADTPTMSFTFPSSSPIPPDAISSDSASSTSLPNTVPQNAAERSSHAAVVAGSVIGTFLFIVFAILGVYIFKRRRKNRTPPSAMFKNVNPNMSPFQRLTDSPRPPPEFSADVKAV